MICSPVRAPRSLRDFLFPSNSAARTLLRARVRVRALTSDRKSLAMTDTAVRPDVHQPFDVHRHLGTKRALDLVVALDDLTQLGDIGVGQILDAEVRIDTRFVEDLASAAAADTKTVRQSDLNLLLTREIDVTNTSHVW